MREKNDYCLRCNQYRLLRSINYFDDRRSGLIISKDRKRINYLCYNCLDEIDKGIKEGKKLINLIGKDFIVSGYGLPKYMDNIRRKLNIGLTSINKALDFINFVYSRWVEVDSNDKFKYHFASLLIILRKENNHTKLEKYIKINYTNTSIDELNEKIHEITLWSNKWNYNPFE